MGIWNAVWRVILWGQSWFATDKHKTPEEYTIDRIRLASMVGAAAFLLPPVVYLSQLFLGYGVRDSISHYYYVPFVGGVFVMALAFIGTFMIAYSTQSVLETRMATLGGIMAFAVAFFPTTGRGIECTTDCNFSARLFGQVVHNTESNALTILWPPGKGWPAAEPQLLGAFELVSWSGHLHYGAAGILLFVLGIFCAFVFTIERPGVQRAKSGKLTQNKWWRNVIYVCCAIAIFGSLLVLGYKSFLSESGNEWKAWNGTLIMEWVSLWAFGIAWLVKGRLFGWAFKDPDEVEAYKRVKALRRGK